MFTSSHLYCWGVVRSVDKMVVILHPYSEILKLYTFLYRSQTTGVMVNNRCNQIYVATQLVKLKVSKLAKTNGGGLVLGEGYIRKHDGLQWRGL